MDYCDVEWLALEMNRNHSVICEVTPKYCTSKVSDSSVDYEGYTTTTPVQNKKFIYIYTKKLNLNLGSFYTEDGESPLWC